MTLPQRIAHIIKHGIIPVGDYRVSLGLEGSQIIHHAGAEEGGAVFQRGLVDNHLGAFGLDAFHDALDGALAEVVGIALHCEAINSDSDFLLFRCRVGVDSGIDIVSRLFQHAVGDVVLACAVAVHNGLDEVLRHIVEVGQQLLGVLREAVSAITEGGVVIVSTNSRIQTDALNDGPGVEAFHLCISVQFVEEADAQGQVSIGEELHGFRLGGTHEEHRHIFLYGAVLDDGGKSVGGFFQCRLVVTNDDAARVKVVVQGL